jgi:hypothetical protein
MHHTCGHHNYSLFDTRSHHNHRCSLLSPSHLLLCGVCCSCSKPPSSQPHLLLAQMCHASQGRPPSQCQQRLCRSTCTSGTATAYAPHSVPHRAVNSLHPSGPVSHNSMDGQIQWTTITLHWSTARVTITITSVFSFSCESLLSRS